MSLTRCQAKYFAHVLDRWSLFGDVKQISATLSNAKLDLNPHQVEAAIFALSSPFSNGVILADEVGLGKTIEAGIFLSQKWSEGKQKVLIILPLNLINQWCSELREKFFLPTFVMDSIRFNEYIKEGIENPFLKEEIIVCTYDFAYKKHEYLQNTDWDIVVFDEAHRLLNVYKQENVISRTLRAALVGKYKLLLTATPFMNTLMELYGITTFVDNEIFGEADSFESQYIFSRTDKDNKLSELSERTKKYCVRTLRHQVLKYIHYTDRICMTQEFSLLPEEQNLYEMVTDYLHSSKIYAINNAGRALVERGLWKRLASSSFAIAGTLKKFVFRLKNIQKEVKEQLKIGVNIANVKRKKYTSDDLRKIENEITTLQNCINTASNIDKNAKSEALLTALENGFNKMYRLGANKKAIIFTESRITQDYLKKLLENNEYKGKIVTINGENNDIDSLEIYNDWLKNKNDIKGSATSNKRAALVAHFKKFAEILIATESASEGLNLQFCSLVINYDLPWNPQRIEQRIGRLHRYGQKNDVVVINFLNKDNIADCRVYELLRYKFKLFDGVFGASDSILGTVDSLDFEKRITDIYSRCRTRQEINEAFDLLQKEFEEVIVDKMETARNTLLSEFDDVVSSRFELHSFETLKEVERIKKMLWQVTQYRLAGNFANFDNNMLKFSPIRKMILGYYAHELYYGMNEPDKSRRYRINHALAKKIVFDVKMNLRVYPTTLNFKMPNQNTKLYKSLKDKSGIFALYSTKIINNHTSYEETPLLVGCANDTDLSQKQLEFLISLPATGDYIRPSTLNFLDSDEDKRIMSISENEYFNETEIKKINDLWQQRFNEYKNEMDKKFVKYVESEKKKYTDFLNDKKISFDLKFKKLDKKIKDKKANLKKVRTLNERLKLDKEVKILSGNLTKLKREMLDKEEESTKNYNEKIKNLEEKMHYNYKFEKAFMVRWTT